MTKPLVLCLLATALLSILGGCATDNQAAGDNPIPIEDNSVTAHGAATVSYGHSVGH